MEAPSSRSKQRNPSIRNKNNPHSGNKRGFHKKRSGKGRGGDRSITADAEKEAQLLPIEWRCQTPPEQHQEVLDAVARSRRALDSADRVAKSIQLKQQGFFGSEEKESSGTKELDNSMQFSPKNSSRNRDQNAFNSIARSNSNDSSEKNASGFDFGSGTSMMPPPANLMPKRAQSYQGGSTNMTQTPPIIMGNYNEALGSMDRTFSAPVTKPQNVNFWGGSGGTTGGSKSNNGINNSRMIPSINTQPQQSFFNKQQQATPSFYPTQQQQSSWMMTAQQQQQPLHQNMMHQSQQQQHLMPSQKQHQPSFQHGQPGQTLWTQQQNVTAPLKQTAQNKPSGGISMSMGGNAPINNNWGNNSISLQQQQQQQQLQKQRQQQPWQQQSHASSQAMYGQQQQQQPQQQHKYMQPPSNQQKIVQPSPNQRRQKNIQSAGKSIVYQDYRDNNAVSKHNGTKSALKYGKPSGTPQGAVVISPAQLRAKSMKNSKHLKGRRKKSSPPIQGTRF